MLTVFAVVFCMTAAVLPASAEEARSAVVEEAVTVVSREQLCELVRRCQEEGSEECRAARASARAAWRRLLERLSLYEERIDQLESRVGGLTDRDAELGRELDELRGRVQELQQALNELSGLTDRVSGLERDVEDEAAAHTRLQRRVGELESRIDAAERRDGYLVYGPISGAFLGFWSPDGVRFTAAQLGLGTVRLRLSDQTQVFIDLGMVLSFAERPFGTYIRGGLRLEFSARGRLGIEIAAGGTWVGLGRKLQAQAAYLMVEPAITWSPRGASWFEIFVSMPIGMRLDGRDPAWAGGFVTGLRITTRSF
jgi:phage shock protein A